MGTATVYIVVREVRDTNQRFAGMIFCGYFLERPLADAALHDGEAVVEAEMDGGVDLRQDGVFIGTEQVRDSEGRLLGWRAARPYLSQDEAAAEIDGLEEFGFEVRHVPLNCRHEPSCAPRAGTDGTIDIKEAAAGLLAGARRVEFAPDDEVRRLERASSLFMHQLFAMAPEDFFVSDESTLADFAGCNGLENVDQMKARIRELFGFEPDTTRLVDLFRQTAQRIN